MSYGSLAGVASFTKIFTDNGEFTDEDCLNCLQELETNPTKSDVTSWLEQFSDTMDVALAGEGFVVPITLRAAVGSINMIVNQYVADMVKYVNNTGRFQTDQARESGVEPILRIEKDIRAWAHSNAAGLDGAGAERRSTPGDQIGSKTNTPIFHRDAFGNSFQDWSKSE